MALSPAAGHRDRPQPTPAVLWALSGLEAEALGTVVGALEKFPAPTPQPKVSPGSYEGQSKTVFAFRSSQHRFLWLLSTYFYAVPRAWGRSPSSCTCKIHGYSSLLPGLGTFSAVIPLGLSAWRLLSVRSHLLRLYDAQSFYFKQKQSKWICHS